MYPDLSYGPHHRQKLDLIAPEGSGPHPLVAYLHGGGWVAGDKASYTRICREFAGRGYLTANVNYRLAPRHAHPTQLRDAAAAIRWIHGRAARFGGDGDRIVLAGDSAGAQLVSWYAAALRNAALRRNVGVTGVVPPRSLKGLVLFYGVFDMEAMFETPWKGITAMMRSLLGSDPDQFRRNARAASPIHHLTDRMPPCFLCASDLDPLRPQTLEMARRLKDLGVELELLDLSGEDYPDARHGFLNFYRRRSSEIALQRALDFAESVCPPAGAPERTDRQRWEEDDG
jgi:acetyl esterase/lipase